MDSIMYISPGVNGGFIPTGNHLPSLRACLTMVVSAILADDRGRESG
jgi:uncharacterized OsmC-like protein